MSSREEVQQGFDQIAADVTEVGERGQALMTGEEFGGLSDEYAKIGALALQLADRVHGLAERHAAYGAAMSPLVEKIGGIQARAIELTEGSTRQPGRQSLAADLAEFMDPFLAVAQYFPVTKDDVEREASDLRAIGRTFGEWGFFLTQRTQESETEISRRVADIKESIDEHKRSL